jgi:hypothetical protein
MKRLVRASLGLLTLACAAALLTHFSSAPASAIAPVPVQVTNTPLPVQGTVNAHINNTTALPIAGTVGVSSLPAVQLSGTSPVSLSNTATTPIYVDADRAARSGFNAECFTGNVDTTAGQAQCALFNIPEGRQVVIESVSCQAELFAGEGPGDVQLIVPNVPLGGGGLTNVHHRLTLTKQAGDSTLDIWAMTTAFRVYGSSPTGFGDQGVYVFFRANPASPPPQGIFCHVSGYLVGQ